MLHRSILLGFSVYLVTGYILALKQLKRIVDVVGMRFKMHN